MRAVHATRGHQRWVCSAKWRGFCLVNGRCLHYFRWKHPWLTFARLPHRPERLHCLSRVPRVYDHDTALTAIGLTAFLMNAGTIEVYPDFNGKRPPYRIHTHGGKPTARACTFSLLCTHVKWEEGDSASSHDFDGHPVSSPADSSAFSPVGEIYEYTIKHVSQTMTKEEKIREGKMYRELYSKHTELLQNRIGHVFEDRIASDSEVDHAYHVFGEVVSAQGFEYDDLYVRLLFDVPHGKVLFFSSSHSPG